MTNERIIEKAQANLFTLTRTALRHASVAPALGRVPAEHISQVHGKVANNFAVSAGDGPIAGIVFRDSQMTLYGERGYDDGFYPYDFTLLLASAPPITFQYPKPLRTATKVDYHNGIITTSKPSSF